MLNDNSFQDFIDFLRKELGQYKLPINADTEIATDLGVVGDDSEDLIFAIQKKSNVDVSRFNIGDCFGSEPTFWGPYNESVKS